jgi:hypothetical protein
MTQEFEDKVLNRDVIEGNVGMVIEHLADANLSPLEIKILLATAIRSRARVKELDANAIDDSFGDLEHSGDKSSFERRRAENLKKLACQIEKL